MFIGSVTFLMKYPCVALLHRAHLLNSFCWQRINRAVLTETMFVVRSLVRPTDSIGTSVASAGLRTGIQAGLWSQRFFRRNEPTSRLVRHSE